MSRSTAKDGRSLLHSILGDAAAARPPLIHFNPAARPRNRGRRTGRRLDRSPQRAWATQLEVLLVAERAALLAGRDDEFTMLVTIGYTGMRWGETTGTHGSGAPAPPGMAEAAGTSSSAPTAATTATATTRGIRQPTADRAGW